MINFELHFVGAAAAGAAAVFVAFEDVPAEARAEGCAPVVLVAFEQIFFGEFAAFELHELFARAAQAAPQARVGRRRNRAAGSQVIAARAAAELLPHGAKVEHEFFGALMSRGVGHSRAGEAGAPTEAFADRGCVAGLVFPGVERGHGQGFAAELGGALAHGFEKEFIAVGQRIHRELEAALVALQHGGRFGSAAAGDVFGFLARLDSHVRPLLEKDAPL